MSRQNAFSFMIYFHNIISWANPSHIDVFSNCLGPSSHFLRQMSRQKELFSFFIPNYLILFQISFQGQSRLTEIQPGDHTHGHVLQPHKEVHSSAKDF